MGLISRNSSGFRFTVSFVYCTACVFVETKVFETSLCFQPANADVLPLHNKQLYDCEIFYSRNSTVEPWYNVGPRDLEICSLCRCFVISRFFSIYFTITGVKKIVHYTEDIVLWSSLYQGSTVLVPEGLRSSAAGRSCYFGHCTQMNLMSFS